MADQSDTTKVFGPAVADAAATIDAAAKGGAGATVTAGPLAANAHSVLDGALKGNAAALAVARATGPQYNNGLAADLAAIAQNREASGAVGKSTDTDPAAKVFGADVVNAVKALSGANGIQGLTTAAKGELTRGADGKPTAQGAAEIAQGMAAVKGAEIATLTQNAYMAQGTNFSDATFASPTVADTNKVFGPAVAGAAATIDAAAKGGAGATVTAGPLAANAHSVLDGALKGNGAALAVARTTGTQYNNGLAADLAAIAQNREASGAVGKSTDTDPAAKVFGADVVNAVKALSGANGIQGLTTAAKGELTRGADGKPTAQGAAEIAQGMAVVKGAEIDTLTASALKAQAGGFKEPQAAPAAITPGAAPIKFDTPQTPSAPLPTPGKGRADTGAISI